MNNDSVKDILFRSDRILVISCVNNLYNVCPSNVSYLNNIRVIITSHFINISSEVLL